MNGKGSAPRPMKINRKQYDRNWDRVYSGKDNLLITAGSGIVNAGRLLAEAAEADYDAACMSFGLNFKCPMCPPIASPERSAYKNHKHAGQPKRTKSKPRPVSISR